MADPIPAPEAARRPALPWVLIRKDRPVLRFASCALGMRFFDQLRFNRGVDQTDAALFGPGGEAWYCRGWRSAEWRRDDDRRRREPPGDAQTGDPPPGEAGHG